MPFVEGDYQSDFMREGQENEALTIATFELQTGLKCETIGGVSTADGMVWASPDRIIRDVGTVEAKSPSGPTQIGYWFTRQDLIDEYWVQCQSQIWVCEFDKAYITSGRDKLPLMA